MIRSLVVRNLRGVKECVIDGLGEVNVLVGRNGAGKSTVLEAVYLASAWVEPRDELRDAYKADYVVSRRAGRGEWSSSRGVLWFVMDTEREIEVDLIFGSGRRLELRVPYCADDPSEAVWLRIPEEKQAQLSVLKEYSYYNFAGSKLLDPRTRVTTSAPRADLAYHLDLVGEDEANFLRKVVLIDAALLGRPELVEKAVWPKLLARRLDKLVIEVVREGFEPDAEDLTYVPFAGTYTLALKLSKTTVRIDDLGDGARAAALTASILATLRNTVALIEDPEVHQHPGGLAKLLSFALRVAKENRVQLIMTTHSVELVNIARRLCEELGLKLKVYFLERGPDGVVDVRALESTDVEALQKLGLDPRLLHVI